MGDCDRLKKYVSDYVEGQLDPSTKRMYEQELAKNPRLREITARVTRVSGLLHDLNTHRCSQDFQIRLRERIHKTPKKYWQNASVRRYSFAFSFTVVVVVAFLTLNDSTKTNTATPFIPSQNAVSSKNNEYNNQSYDVKTRDEQTVIQDSVNTRMKDKKDPHIKYVDTQK